MRLRTQFGQRLQKLRKYKGLTQAQFSEAMGISIEMVSNMERGVNGPSFDTLEKIIRVLKIPIHELFLFED
ncbi:MAG: transcriptional regulator with XRE-family HTH domain [bacterium]|jgi:transcriptional regulator with XRE-family HTH domain